MEIFKNMMKDEIVAIMMKENPTPEEALVIEAYRRGYFEGRREPALKHNDMLNKALNGAERVRYKKMLKGFLSRYFSYLNVELKFEEV